MIGMGTTRKDMEKWLMDKKPYTQDSEKLDQIILLLAELCDAEYRRATSVF